MCCADSHGFLSPPPRHRFAALSSFQIPPGLTVPGKARHSIELPFSPLSILKNSTKGGQPQWRQFRNKKWRPFNIKGRDMRKYARTPEMSEQYFVRRSMKVLRRWVIVVVGSIAPLGTRRTERVWARRLVRIGCGRWTRHTGRAGHPPRVSRREAAM